MIKRFMDRRRKFKFIFFKFGAIVALILAIVGVVISRTLGRTLVQFDIHQNKELIHLSTFADPTQFAI